MKNFGQTANFEQNNLFYLIIGFIHQLYRNIRRLRQKYFGSGEPLLKILYFD